MNRNDSPAHRFLFKTSGIAILSAALSIGALSAQETAAPNNTQNADATNQTSTSNIVGSSDLPADALKSTLTSKEQEARSMADQERSEQVKKEAAQAASIGMKQFVFTGSDGTKIPYSMGIYNADRPEKFAVLLFLHGEESRGSDNLSQLIHGVPAFVAQAKEMKTKLLILAPQCPAQQQWVDTPLNGHSQKIAASPTPSMKLVMELLEQRVKALDADSSRLFVAGISMGAFGVWDLLAREPNLFAAAIAICGGGDPEMAKNMKDLPILIYHGESDNLVPPNRSAQMFHALKNAGNTRSMYHELKNCGHEAWIPAFNNLDTFKWLFAQKRIQK